MTIKQFTTKNNVTITIGKDLNNIYTVIENNTREYGGNIKKANFNLLELAIKYINNNYIIKRIVF